MDRIWRGQKLAESSSRNQNGTTTKGWEAAKELCNLAAPWGSVTLSVLPAVTLEPARRHCYENMFIIILINIIIIINNMIFGAFMHINFKQTCAVAGSDAATNKQLQRGSLIYIKSFMLI